ncbi:hypothetical protein LOK49_LG15G00669 [Camellia lanceoleosa]|uniref:Uncharacterized protein n=1 Tax=Camellia lanceoleosa TaxID=1840588 RepID=A0ACC0F2V2_9ERIC|nr:hypothetical protein LOK49_LG15G00669 [Camellia lanceoleosa]
MSFSSNYYSSGENFDLRYEALKCDCGLRAAIRVTESDKPSKGRLYFICEKRYIAEFVEEGTTPPSPAESTTGLKLHVLAFAGSAPSGQEYSWQQTEHHPVRLQSVEVTLRNQPNPSQSTNANLTATIRSCFFNSSLLKWKVMNNRCAKFRTKPLEHVDLMERVYSVQAIETCMDSNGENTVGECLARLMSTPGLETGGQLFSFACGIMDSPDNREIIMALPQNCIVNWLTEKRACTPHNIGMDRQGGTRLFGSGGAVDLD